MGLEHLKIRNYQSIIWDWNGTLLNDVDFCVNCMNQLLEAQKLPLLTKEKYQEVFTFPVQDYYKEIGFDFNIESFDKVGHLFMNYYSANIKTCELHPTAISILQMFEEANIPQYMLSAMEHNSLVNMLDKRHIFSFFRGVYGIDNLLGAGKAHRANTLMQEHKIDPKSCLLIGDTLHDKEVGDLLGCSSLLIANGHQNKKRLQSSGGLVLNNLEELQKYF